MLRRWKTDINKETERIAWYKLVHLEEDVLEHIIEEVVIDDYVMQNASTTRLNPITGAIELVDLDANGNPQLSEKQLIKDKIYEFKSKVLGLGDLQDELMAVAGIATLRVAEQLLDDKLGSRDIVNLTSALTNINNSFFAKPSTAVNVLNVGGNDQGLLAKFKNNMGN